MPTIEKSKQSTRIKKRAGLFQFVIAMFGIIMLVFITFVVILHAIHSQQDTDHNVAELEEYIDNIYHQKQRKITKQRKNKP